MFATVRRYSPKTGSITNASIDKLRQQLQTDFVPMIQKVMGFHGYYALKVGENQLLTMSLFETRAGAAESTNLAADFIKRNPMPFELGLPEVTEGEVLAMAEAAREVGAH
jgi:hypothetical protein